MITALLGLDMGNNPDRIFLSVWPSEEGSLPGGGFDVDAWEDAQIHFGLAPGADPRIAWKEVYRRVRFAARQMGGLEWMDTMLEWEPCPLPKDMQMQDVA